MSPWGGPGFCFLPLSKATQLSPLWPSIPLEGKKQVWKFDVIPILVHLLKDPVEEVKANAAGALMYATVTTAGELACWLGIQVGRASPAWVLELMGGVSTAPQHSGYPNRFSQTPRLTVRVQVLPTPCPDRILLACC